MSWKEHKQIICMLTSRNQTIIEEVVDKNCEKQERPQFSPIMCNSDWQEKIHIFVNAAKLGNQF